MLKVILRKGGFTPDNDYSNLIGIWPGVDNILTEEFNCIKSCEGKIFIDEEGNLIIEVTSGNLILKSLRVELIQKKHNVSLVTLKVDNQASAIIIDQLNNKELYKIIINFYAKFIAMPSQDQRNLYKDSGVILTDSEWESYEEHIKDSHEIVDGFHGNTNPDSSIMLNLCEMVISGSLEYGFHLKDKSSVKMFVYALALGSRLSDNNLFKSYNSDLSRRNNLT